MFESLGNDKIKMELVLKNKDNYYYRIFDLDNNYVGNCGIRLHDDDLYYLGNIEYEIFPPFRGNNYGYESSKLLCTIASYYNLDSITITANPFNNYSLNIIKKLGGNFIEYARISNKSKLYKGESHYIARYSVDLKGVTL